jgi:hypothetical protein
MEPTTGAGASGAQLVAGTVQWASLGAHVRAPVTASDMDARLQVFGVGHDGTVWQAGQLGPHLWTGWRSLGGPATSSLAVGRHRDGTLDVFARGADNALRHAWQTEPGSTEWSGWKQMSGTLHGAPTMGQDDDGRLHVFVRRADGALWRLGETDALNRWGEWGSLGGNVFDPVAASNRDGRMGGVRARPRRRTLARVAAGPWRMERVGVARRRDDQPARRRGERGRAAGGVRPRGGQRALARLADGAQRELGQVAVAGRPAALRPRRRPQRERAAGGVRRGNRRGGHTASSRRRKRTSGVRGRQ